MHGSKNVKFQVLIAVLLNIQVFWAASSFRSVQLFPEFLKDLSNFLSWVNSPLDTKKNIIRCFETS
jgi:hypothetical protein